MRTILTILVALMLNAGAAGATGNKLLAKHRAYEQVAATNLTNDIKVAAEAEACQSYIWGAWMVTYLGFSGLMEPLKTRL